MGELGWKTGAVDRRPIIAVIGASFAETDVLTIAEALGRALAQTGWHLLCGGGSGVMEAACRGYVACRTSAGGMTIGILPSGDATWANPFVDLPIATGMGWARNAIIVQTASALVAVGGCSGTLSEIALGWQAGRPIAALANTGGWAEALAGRAVDPRRSDVVFAAAKVDEVIAFLKSKLGC